MPSADTSLFERAFRDAAIGMALVGLDGRWLQVNDAVCTILGYRRDELLERDFQSLTYPDDLSADLALAAKLIAGEIPSYHLDKRYLHRDGRVVWATLTVSLVRRDEPGASFFVSQIQDISARRQAEAEAKMFFDHSADMLAIAGTTGTLQKVNPAWERTLGLTSAELTSRPFLDFVHPDDREMTIAEAAATYEGRPTPNFCNRYLSGNGSYRWLEWSTRPMSDGRLFCVARDVSARVRHEEQIKATASLDAATQLLNRRGFDQRAETLLERAAAERRIALLAFCDLDGLKAINDTLGHDVGDSAIRDAAQVLSAAARDSDLVARVGGDEFVVLGLVRDELAATAFAERLRDSIHAHNAGARRDYHVAMSVGTASWTPDAPKTLDALMREADAAMYVQKRARRGESPAPRPASLPADEQARLGALDRLGMRGAPADPALELLVRIAARVAETPIALVSLIDAETQFFAARLGLEIHETSREVAFCAHTILHSRPMVVEDALADARFARNPLVLGEPDIRAYAGAPIETSTGHRVGTLCVIDRRPRIFSPGVLALLRDLATQAAQVMEQRGSATERSARSEP